MQTSAWCQQPFPAGMLLVEWGGTLERSKKTSEEPAMSPSLVAPQEICYGLMPPGGVLPEQSSCSSSVALLFVAVTSAIPSADPPAGALSVRVVFPLESVISNLEPAPTIRS